MYIKPILKKSMNLLKILSNTMLCIKQILSSKAFIALSIKSKKILSQPTFTF